MTLRASCSSELGPNKATRVQRARRTWVDEHMCSSTDRFFVMASLKVTVGRGRSLSRDKMEIHYLQRA